MTEGGASDALRRTFQLISGVGPWREKDLWAQGVANWDDFIKLSREGRAPLASKKLDPLLNVTIETARTALKKKDLLQLSKMVVRREHWRLYRHFENEVAFFDIEADGDRQPTVASVLGRDGVQTFIRHRNFDDLLGVLNRHPIWVTFNGGSFDIPVLKHTFPSLRDPLVHIDLKVLTRVLKFRGGLKSIESNLGWHRPPHLTGVGGLQAIQLWNQARSPYRSKEALRILVEYNLYDSISLKSLLEWCLNRAAEEYGWHSAPDPVFSRTEVLYDVSKIVLGL